MRICGDVGRPGELGAEAFGGEPALGGICTVGPFLHLGDGLLGEGVEEGTDGEFGGEVAGDDAEGFEGGLEMGGGAAVDGDIVGMAGIDEALTAVLGKVLKGVEEDLTGGEEIRREELGEGLLDGGDDLLEF